MRRQACILAAILMAFPAFNPGPANGELADPGALADHTAISITGDSQFTSANGVVSGDGSASDPYIIENHSIEESSWIDGILVQGTTKHFVIRNCYIHGSSTWIGSGAGIYINNANNGTINNNKVIFRYNGIQISGSTGIEVYDNNITQNTYGISLSGGGSQSWIHDNDVNNNTRAGIYISGTSNQTIEENYVHDNKEGITISSSPGIHLFNNTMSGNKFSFTPYESLTEDYPANNTIEGNPLRWVRDKADWTFNLTAGYIALVNCTNVTVRDMTLTNDSAGVLLLDSTNITLQNLTLESNAAGVKASGSTADCTIRECVFRNNTYGALLAGSTHAVLVVNCTFENNTDGVLIQDSAHDHTVKSNDLARNGQGIVIDYGSDRKSGSNLIIENSIDRSSENGIVLMAAWKNQLTGNYITNCSGYGIWLRQSANNVLSGNTMRDNWYNFGMMDGRDFDTTLSLLDNTVYTNNTVDDKKIYVLKGKDKETVPDDAGYVALVNCTNMIVQNLTISRSGEGIVAFQTTGTTIQNDTINDVVYGILLVMYCDNTVIKNCNLTNGTAYSAGVYQDGDGIHAQDCDGTQVKNCIVSNFDGTGIKILGKGQKATGKAVLEGNSLSSNKDFAVWVQNNPSPTVKGNTISDNPGGGITVCYLSSAQVTYNNITRSDQSISLYDGLTSPTISNNNISDGFVGILDIYGGSSGITIKNNLIWGMTRGLDVSVKGTTFTTNTIHDCKYGMELYYPDSVSLTGNKFYNNTYSLYIYGSNADLNSMSLSTDNTIDGKPVYLWKSQSGKTVPDDAGMIILVSCSKVTVKDVALAHNGEGVILSSSDDCIVQNISCKSMYWDGILILGGSDRTVINDSLFYGSYHRGIELDTSTYTKIYNNTFIGSGEGVQVNMNANTGNTIYNNTFSQNGAGIYFCGGANTNSTIYNNTFFDNLCGLDGGLPDGFTIYNNYFQNDYNVGTDYTMKGIWNLTKTAGSNIVGGSYLGGNFWSDYDGSDQDGDGLGDTGVPFGPGDKLPLIITSDGEAPSVTDETSGAPTTSEDFNFAASATDNTRVGGVQLEYWINGADHHNLTMVKTSGNDTGASFRLDIQVPSNATYLVYRLSAWDLSGNWNSTEDMSVDVTDNDPPVISDCTTRDRPTTGDSFLLQAVVTDNIGLGSVDLDYWCDDGAQKNVILAGQGDLYSQVVTISSNATTLHYSFSAQDGAGNELDGPQNNLTVADNDAPVVADITTGTPRTDKDFSVNCSATDNVKVSGLTLRYSFDAGSGTDVSINANSGGYFEYAIPMKDTAQVLKYAFTGKDAAGNADCTDEKAMPIADFTAPAISDKTGPADSGANVNITVAVTDNHALGRVFLEYWFDCGTHVNVSLAGQSPFSTPASVPAEALTISIQVWANDTSGNINTARFDKPVVDVILPVLTDLSGNDFRTGQCVTVSCNATDNRGINSVCVEYWFDSGTHTNVSMSGSPNYSTVVEIPDNAVTMTYVLWVNDSAGNVNLSRADRQVADIFVPVIEDLTGSDPRTGRSFDLICHVTDNIGLANVTVEYWFDSGPHTNVSMSGGPAYFSTAVNVPQDALTMSYLIRANDTAGNANTTLSLRQVTDVISPVITDLTESDPKTGQIFVLTCNVTDNIGPENVTVEYWFDARPHATFGMAGNGSYILSLNIPADARTLSYVIRARDAHGNNASLTGSKDILDIEAPKIVDATGEPTTGDDLRIDFTATDNWNVTGTSFEYWFDGGIHVLVFNTSNLTVVVPSNASVMHYRISARDAAAHETSVAVDRPVKDNDVPQLNDLTGVPSDGRPFRINMTMADNIAVSDAFLLYDFDGGSEVNISFNGSALIDVPTNAGMIHYKVRVSDTAGLWTELESGKAVLDVISPIIKLHEASPRTGAAFDFIMEISDNRGAVNTTVEFWLDGAGHTVKTATTPGEQKIQIEVPAGSRLFNYRITALDPAGLVAFVNGSVPVCDTIKPEISDATGQPVTGTDIRLDISVVDNIGVNDTSVEYWFDNGTHQTVAYSAGLTIPVPENAVVLNYIIKAMDVAGNIASNDAHRDVKDVMAPLIGSVNATKVSGGTKLKVNVNASDNVGIASVTVRITQGSVMAYPLSFDGSGYSGAVPIRSDKRGTYNVTVTDGSGLTIERSGNFTASPAVSSGSQMSVVAYALIGAVVAIGVVAVVIRARKRK